ncbi:MAG: gluconokinase [Flavobacteriaceae bacterium]
MNNLEVILVMGVSGTGKTTVSKALAQEMNAIFIDADDFHPQPNVIKMSQGIPLNDQDRLPWLQAIRAHMEVQNSSIVLACSALKESYREQLRSNIYNLKVVVLQASYEVLEGRMRRRTHFMPSSLLKSQLDTLEIPDYGLHISSELQLKQVVSKITNYLNHNLWN